MGDPCGAQRALHLIREHREACEPVSSADPDEVVQSEDLHADLTAVVCSIGGLHEAECSTTQVAGDDGSPRPSPFDLGRHHGEACLRRCIERVECTTRRAVVTHLRAGEQRAAPRPGEMETQIEIERRRRGEFEEPDCLGVVALVEHRAAADDTGPHDAIGDGHVRCGTQHECGQLVGFGEPARLGETESSHQCVHAGGLEQGLIAQRQSLVERFLGELGGSFAPPDDHERGPRRSGRFDELTARRVVEEGGDAPQGFIRSAEHQLDHPTQPDHLRRPRPPADVVDRRLEDRYCLVDLVEVEAEVHRAGHGD